MNEIEMGFHCLWHLENHHSEQDYVDKVIKGS